MKKLRDEIKEIMKNVSFPPDTRVILMNKDPPEMLMFFFLFQLQLQILQIIIVFVLGYHIDVVFFIFETINERRKKTRGKFFQLKTGISDTFFFTRKLINENTCYTNS